MVEYICNALIDSDIENKKTKSAIEMLEPMWQQRGGFRAKSGARRTLKKKIVRFRKTEKRVRIYAAEELIQLLSRPFGSEKQAATVAKRNKNRWIGDVIDVKL